MQTSFTDAPTRQLMVRIECVEASVRLCKKQTITLKPVLLELPCASTHVKKQCCYALLRRRKCSSAHEYPALRCTVRASKSAHEMSHQPGTTELFRCNIPYLNVSMLKPMLSIITRLRASVPPLSNSRLQVFNMP